MFVFPSQPFGVSSSFARFFAAPANPDGPQIDDSMRNPLTETFEDLVQEEEVDEIDPIDLDPRHPEEDQLEPLSEHPLYQRAWQKFFERRGIHAEHADALIWNAEQEAEEEDFYTPPWVGMLGMPAMLEGLEEEWQDLYRAEHPDLVWTDEDARYRAMFEAHLDLDQPGGAWGENRMTFGLSPPVKIYYKAMIRAKFLDDKATITKLYEGCEKDLQVARHEIPAGMHRLMLWRWSRVEPFKAHEYFSKILATNDAESSDYEMQLGAYMYGGEHIAAWSVYDAYRNSRISAEVSPAAHCMGYAAAVLNGDAHNVKKIAAVLEAIPYAVPGEAEIAHWKMIHLFQINDVAGAMEAFKRVEDTISAVEEQERREELLISSSVLVLRAINQKNEFERILGIYRRVCSEVGDKWIFSSVPTAVIVIRAYTLTGDAEEARRLVQVFLDAREQGDNSEVDPAIPELFAPFAEDAVRRDSQKDLEAVFAAVKEHGLADDEDSTEYSTLYLAAMRARPDDFEHLNKFFIGVDPLDPKSDEAVGLYLHGLIKAGKWEEARGSWRAAARSGRVSSLKVYEAFLAMVTREPKLDDVILIARSLTVSGVRITDRFAGELARILWKTLPEKVIAVPATAHLLRRLISNGRKNTSQIVMSRKRQSGALHVLEKVRATVQEHSLDEQ